MSLLLGGDILTHAAENHGADERRRTLQDR